MHELLQAEGDGEQVVADAQGEDLEQGSAVQCGDVEQPTQRRQRVAEQDKIEVLLEWREGGQRRATGQGSVEGVTVVGAVADEQSIVSGVSRLGRRIFCRDFVVEERLQ